MLPDDGWSTEVKVEFESDVEILEQIPSQAESISSHIDSSATTTITANVSDGWSVLEEQLRGVNKASATAIQESPAANESLTPLQSHRKRRKKLSTTEGKAAKEYN
ncbi:unnamed protein product [Phytophthora lilii]|uniref:Unnamed protein product n=1 Tax=Phytophthora lilii TaxID=2077276 RepID=A0A9W6U0W7_9STRA|nr:unnamed protein product [Phytophthora lilii]